MASQLWRLSAREMAAGVAEGRFSAVDLADAALARVEDVNGAVNAICTLNPQARDEAAAADARLKSGAAPRPLEGVPFVVKDNIETKGLRTTFGSLTRQDFVPETDGVCVERLRDAGAVLLGKGNTPEFAHDVVTTNRIFGPTRNPWDLRRTAGGSSGGSAAAVSAGMVPLSIGTDLGGSIRVPSAFNGLVGLRTVPGGVPIHPTDFAWDTLTSHVHGPMARSVGDVCLAMTVLAGPDARDPRSLRTVKPDYAACLESRSLKGKRLLCVRDFAGAVPTEPAVLALAETAVARLEALGAEVVWEEIPLDDLLKIVVGTRAFGMVARFGSVIETNRDDLMAQLVNQVEGSLKMSLRDVTEAERLRTVYWNRMRPYLTEYDAIISPATGIPAFRLDEALPTKVGGKTVERFYDTLLAAYAFTVVDAAAVVVPSGLTPEGLPTGIQIVGGRLSETAALDIAVAYERAYPELFSLPDIDLGVPLSNEVRATTGGYAIR
jgi:amidase